MHKPLLLVLGLVTLVTGVRAQGCSLVLDINQQGQPLGASPRAARTGPGNTDPADGMLRFGNDWYFVATTIAAGEELWKTDGTTAGTTMVKDIQPGPAGSRIGDLVVCNGSLFFRADDGIAGSELWTSDGTTTGTTMVIDLIPGSSGSTPRYLVCMNKVLYFSASDTANGAELWSSDGTAAGSKLVADIRKGSSGSEPAYLMVDSSDSRIYFVANDGIAGVELWTSDGTTAGTSLVLDIHAGPASSSPNYIQNLGSVVVFAATDATNGTELWKSDGTAAGTVMIVDILAGGNGSSPDLYFRAESVGSLYFSADDGASGRELWSTDGTVSGTTLVADIDGSSTSSDPNEFCVVGTTVYFTASTPAGRELWRWDGSNASQVADIYPGSSSSSPNNLFPFGTELLFSAYDGSSTGKGREMYRSDGTPAGTVQVFDLNPGTASSTPAWLTSLSPNRILFSADDQRTNGVGRELFETDGTAAGTKVIRNMEPGSLTDGSAPSNLVCIDGETLYFQADDAQNGAELWKADRSGTVLVKDIQPGAVGSNPAEFTSCWNGTSQVTVFRADGGVYGSELWRTDGTTAGTGLIKDILTGSVGSRPSGFVSCLGKAFFVATDVAHGTELWVTDGTFAGTSLVKDISPGPSSASPDSLVCCNGRLFFAATDNGISGAGRELWTSDGTSSGTVMLADLEPGSGSSSPAELTRIRDRIVFRATDSKNGSELFVSDGTAAGTALLLDIQSGSTGSFPAQLIRSGDRVYFTADDGSHGTELWETDLTAAGTKLVADLVPGSGSSSPLHLTDSETRLFFSAYSAGTGRELYVTDGSTTGTVLVTDLYPGGSSSGPSFLVRAGAGVFFSAFVPTSAGGEGTELYVSDGTAAGTVRHCDIWPGALSGSPRNLTVCDGVLYFTANDGMTGTELHRVDGNPGTVESYGASCRGQNLEIRCTKPLLGANAEISGTGILGAYGLLVIGDPAPRFTVAKVVAPDCGIWIELSYAALFPLSPGANWIFPVMVPTLPALIGSRMVVQSAYDPLPLSVSNALRVVLGK